MWPFRRKVLSAAEEGAIRELQQLISQAEEERVYWQKEAPFQYGISWRGCFVNTEWNRHAERVNLAFRSSRSLAEEACALVVKRVGDAVRLIKKKSRPALGVQLGAIQSELQGKLAAMESAIQEYGGADYGVVDKLARMMKEGLKAARRDWKPVFESKYGPQSTEDIEEREVVFESYNLSPEKYYEEIYKKMRAQVKRLLETRKLLKRMVEEYGSIIKSA